MSATKIVFYLLICLVGQGNGQEMSPQWYREKELSWEKARADYPECSYDGVFKKRILELDAWAKENDAQLYYNPNKPYLLAQMVQKEIDDLAAKQQQEVARQRTLELERAAALQQEAILQQAARANAGGVSQRGTDSPTPIPQQTTAPVPTDVDRGRGDLTRPALATIFLGGAIIVFLTSGVAWVLYRIIRPRAGAVSASALGRKWAARTVAFTTMSLLTRFFLKFDANSFALWLLIVPVFGVFAFLSGWIIGLFRFGQMNDPNSLEPVSPPRSEQEIGNDATEEGCMDGLSECQRSGAPGLGQSEVGVFQENPPQPIMNTNEFEVEIPEGIAIGNGYVEMRHNTQYSLQLKNHRWVPCDAEVAIDGTHVGTWRINARNEIRIERPVHDAGHFTFFEVGTKEAGIAGIDKNSDNGLVSVTFKPKKESYGLNAAPLPVNEHSAGATGLTGESQQRFRDVPEIEHDMAHAFTIHLRLVSRRPDIRPLAPRSTPIPPPVG